MHIVHVIAGLEIGGAELMLKRLVLSQQRHVRFQHSVISLTGLGAVGADMRSKGVDVRALGMSSVTSAPLAVWRLLQALRELRPALVHTWMYHADFFGGLAGRLLGSKVVWGIRSTGIPQGRLSLTWWLVRINALCSWFVPHRIVCCAEAAQTSHLAIGYARDKMLVIPNGYDFSQFARSDAVRETIRRQCGFASGDVVVGVVGRFDDLKDFPNFIHAARLMALQCPHARFLMVGRGLDRHNPALCSLIAGAGLGERVSLVGEQADVPAWLAAMDIFCLSSRQEAFPNVVVEAMAMALPCVVTNAGDAALIVGDCGWVVPVQDSAALGEALVKVCRLAGPERAAVALQGAQRVRARYDMDTVRRNYESVYDALMPGPT